MSIDEAKLSVILIAPNVSRRMGGEAIKSLQIYQALADRGVDLHQITHVRVRAELRQDHPEMNVTYIEDDRLALFLWNFRTLRFPPLVYFMSQAARVARDLVAKNPGAVVHYTSPISPVLPLFPIKGAKVVVGPINGNIHHPPAFRARESKQDKLRRMILAPSQWFHRAFFSGKQTADVILVAGGERTYQSLRIAGCREEQFRDTLDSGIPDSLLEQPPVEHAGTNLRFVHHGRLVPYKGTDLAIKAVARAKNPVELDVIGLGDEIDNLKRMAADLGVADRVHFVGWVDHADLIPRLRQYRGFVAPSLAEANGIAFQEAMMIGLPTICVDWGGPALLITPETGFLIEPTDEEHVVAELAAKMDQLAEDGALANRMAIAARAAAVDRGFAWSGLIDKWMAIYRELSPNVDPSRPPTDGEARRETGVDLFRHR